MATASVLHLAFGRGHFEGAIGADGEDHSVAILWYSSHADLCQESLLSTFRPFSDDSLSDDEDIHSSKWRQQGALGDGPHGDLGGGIGADEDGHLVAICLTFRYMSRPPALDLMTASTAVLHHLRNWNGA